MMGKRKYEHTRENGRINSIFFITLTNLMIKLIIRVY